MKFLYLTLALEWPFLVVALALSSWGLSFIIDQRDYKRGSLFPEYGNQIITYTSAWLSTSTSNATPVSTIARTTYTITATLSPNEYGTAYYSSVYSRIGSIPPFQTITNRAAIPIQTSTNNDKRAYWADHSTKYTNVYGSLDGDPRSFVAAMIIPFSLLIASLAVRILITFVFFAHLYFAHLTQKAKHQWNQALVSLTAIFIVVLWGSTISSLSIYGSYYNDTISQSVGLLVTIVFCSISCISSVFALVFMCMELHKSKKGNQLQNEKNTFTRDSIASDTSSA